MENLTWVILLIILLPLVLFIRRHVLAHLHRMVLQRENTGIFLKLLVLFFFPLLFPLYFGVRPFSLLFIYWIECQLLFSLECPHMKNCLVKHLHILPCVVCFRARSRNCLQWQAKHPFFHMRVISLCEKLLAVPDAPKNYTIPLGPRYLDDTLRWENQNSPSPKEWLDGLWLVWRGYAATMWQNETDHAQLRSSRGSLCVRSMLCRSNI